MHPDISDRILIHIGLPKCASTSLQQLFAASPRIFYLGKTDIPGPRSFRNEFIHTLTRGFLVYQDASTVDLRQIRTRLASLCRAALETGAEYVVLSDELLSGIGFANYVENRHPDPLRIFQNIQALFGSVHILLLIREPLTLLRSYYAYLLGQGYNLGFFQFIASRLEPHAPLARVLAYHDHITELARINPNLNLLPTEWIDRQPDDFNALLARFGIDGRKLPCENRTHTNVEFMTLLRYNLHQVRDAGIYSTAQELVDAQQFVDSGHPLYWLEAGTNERLRKHFSDQCYALDQTYGLNLEDLGYF